MQSSEFFRPLLDEAGFCQLTFSTPEGKEIFLHNAFEIGSGNHHPESEIIESEIQANTLVFDAENLGKSKKIRRIRFTCEDLNNFFFYKGTETHYFSSKVMKENFLKEMRGATNNRIEKSLGLNQNNENFIPNEVIFVRKPITIMKFKHMNHTYNIWSEHNSRGGNYSGREIEKRILCEIVFKKNVEIRHALKTLYDWILFFHK